MGFDKHLYPVTNRRNRDRERFHRPPARPRALAGSAFHHLGGALPDAGPHMTGVRQHALSRLALQPGMTPAFRPHRRSRQQFLFHR